jgi:hypothetical protein
MVIVIFLHLVQPNISESQQSTFFFQLSSLNSKCNVCLQWYSLDICLRTYYRTYFVGSPALSFAFNWKTLRLPDVAVFGFELPCIVIPKWKRQARPQLIWFQTLVSGCFQHFRGSRYFGEPMDHFYSSHAGNLVFVKTFGMLSITGSNKIRIDDTWTYSWAA